MQSCYHCLLLLVAVLSALNVAPSAIAATLTALGPIHDGLVGGGILNQSFSASITDLSGTFSATGGGAVFDSKNKAVTSFAIVPPTSHALSLFESPVFLDHYDDNGNIDANGGIPQDETYYDYSDSLGYIAIPQVATWTLSDLQLHSLINIQGLNVRLNAFPPGNNSSIPFALSTLTLHTNSTVAILKNVSLDFTADVLKIGFLQTGDPAFASTGDGVGTFSIPGDFFIDPWTKLFVFGLIPYDNGGLHSPVATDLTGSYTVSNLPGAGRHIALDGAMTLQVPVGFHGVLDASLDSPAALTISSTIDLLSTVTINIAYHLETNLVPEPGSSVLALVGAVLVAGANRQRRNRR